MARDLYGEILSRVLQRQPPPGHLPSYGSTTGSSSVMYNGQDIPRSYGQGDHYVELAYLTPPEQDLLADVDMYNSSPPHPGPAGIPNFNDSGNGGGGGGGGGAGGDGDADDDGVAGGTTGDDSSGAGSGADTGAVGGGGGPSGGGQSDVAGPAQGVDMGAGMPTSAAEAQGQTQAMADITMDDAISVNANAMAFMEAHTNAANNSQVTTAEQQQQNENSLVNAVNAQVVSNAQAAAIAQTDISQGGLGSMSPGGFAAAHGEVAATMAQIAAINHADPSVTHGYSINNQQPTAASLAASQAFAQVNPTITNTMFGVAGMMPGPMGIMASLAGAHAGHGFGSMASDALSDVPGVGALSEAISGITSPVTGAISAGVTALGEGLSLGAQAVNEALGGTDTPGVGQQGGPSGDSVADIGGPDIVPVPPVAASPVVPEAVRFSETAPVATTSDIDDATRQRILANIVGGLERTDRPTEGVTAFGPLFT
jgi:hypothetical protein